MLTVYPRGATVVAEWEVWNRNSAGQLIGKPKRTRVEAGVDGEVTERALSSIAARMARYMDARTMRTGRAPRVTKWREGSSPFVLVPPSGGEGGEKSAAADISRSADTAQAKTPLPSSMPPRGAGGGGERSDHVSAVDPAVEQLPGQLQLPL